MKTNRKLHLWAVLTVTWVLGVSYVQAQGEDPGGGLSARIALASPPDGLTLVGPLNLPLIAEVEGLSSGDVSVEFLNGEMSLGRVDSPFSVLPDPTGELEAGPSGIYSWTWEHIPAGTHEIRAVLWRDGSPLARSVPSTLEILQLDETTEVGIRVADPIAMESSDDLLDTGSIIIERSGRTDFPLEVYFEWGGDAMNGSDFRASTGSITIPEGESRVEVSLQPIDDSIQEREERAILRVVPPVCIDVFPPPVECYLVGKAAEGTVVIRDNDRPLENQPPLVVLTHPLSGQGFREGSTIELEAHAWDMDGRVETIEFYAGARLLGAVKIEPDSEPPSVGEESTGSEGLPVPPARQVGSWQWENVPAGRYLLTARAIDERGGSTVSGSVGIAVVEQGKPPVVVIDAVDGQASEQGTPAATRPGRADIGRFVIKRSGSTRRALQVGLQITGTATNGKDYRQIDERVTIPANQASTTIDVFPLNDREVEGTETVQISLKATDCGDAIEPQRRCYVVGRAGRAQVEILDDDRSNQNLPPSVEIVRPTEGSEFREGQTIHLFARASDRDGRVLMVEFFANGESVGRVRARSSGRQNQHVFHVRVRDLEPGRYQLVAVATDNDEVESKSRPVRMTVGMNHVRTVVQVKATDSVAAEVSVERNDRPEGPSFQARALSNVATFVIGRTGRTEGALRIPYELTGSAENGKDYLRLPGFVEMAEGETRAEVQIVPLDDALVEGRESVVLTLKPTPCIAIFPPPADCYSLGRNQEARATIRDNDERVNQVPRIALVSPRNGSEFKTPDRIGLKVETADSDGFVRQVIFFANGRKIGAVKADRAMMSDEIQTFEFDWNKVGPGRYRLEALAEDNDGGEARSGSLSIAVLEDVIRGTVVSVTAIDSSASETIRTDGTPMDVGRFRFMREGNLANRLKVSFRIGGSAVNGRDYHRVMRSFEFMAGENAVDLVIEPIDDREVEGTESVLVELVPPRCPQENSLSNDCYRLGENASAGIRLFDNDRDRNLAPKVAIVKPRTRAVFHAPADVGLGVEAVDGDGWIGRVELYAGRLLVAEETINFVREPEAGEGQRFSLRWENAPIGTHELTAVVTDNEGASARSRTVSIRVKGERERPVVTVLTRDGLGVEPVGERKANPASVRFFRSGKSESDLIVHYEIEGSAENGVDYEKLEGRIVIPANKRWVTLTVLPLADDLVEGRESVVIRLTEAPASVAGAAYEIGRSRRAGVVIANRHLSVQGPTRLKDGLVHIAIPAQNGKSFRIEAGNQIGQWDTIGMSTATDDAIHIIDTESTATTARFFRLVPDLDLDQED